METIRGLKNAVKENRAFKADALEQKIKINGGQDSAEFMDLREGFDFQLEFMRHEHKDWIGIQHADLADYLIDVPEEAIEASFKKGARSLLKLYSRYLKNIDEPIADILGDKKFLRSIISAFAADFILSLRSSRKSEVAPLTALKIAQRSFRFNPDFLIELQKEYPEFENWLFVRAIGAYAEPKAYLDSIKEVIPKLQADYPEFEPWLIMLAAAGHSKDPEKFLNKLKADLPELQSLFPDIEPWAILTALANYAEPRDFLNNFRGQFPLLEKDFPDIDTYMIHFVTVNSPRSAKTVLTNVRKAVPELQRLFPEFSKSVIARIAINKNAALVLEKVSALLPQLQLRFPEFTKGILQEVALRHRRDPEPLLETAAQQFKLFREKYPTIPKGYIMTAVALHQHDPEGFLDKNYRKI